MSVQRTLPLLLCLSFAVAFGCVSHRHTHSNPRVIRQLVAAWDFENTGRGPLADKAPGGDWYDDLSGEGSHTMQGSVLLLSSEGAAFTAAGTGDLDLTGPLTIWARMRVHDDPAGAMPLIVKASEASHSYGMTLTPDDGQPNHYGIGGSLSYSVAETTRVHAEPGPEMLPVGAWREVALVVRPGRHGLVARWYASDRPVATATRHWHLVNGPVELPARQRLLSVESALYIGGGPGSDGPTAVVELDELRLYERGLTLRELTDLEAGSLGTDEPKKMPEDEEPDPAKRDVVRASGATELNS
ncbi:MAG: LamG domain-containing protein [bacterium]|nr:LamG domain-containing protein [bacterium]